MPTRSDAPSSYQDLSQRLPPKASQQVELKDGRLLGYAQFGEDSGETVFYFHGWPGSRLEPWAAIFGDAAGLPVRLIAVDRPGYGLSTLQPDRSILAWTSDIVELATHLGVSKFSVIGISGGGPYAMACALTIPELLNRVVLVCSMGPAQIPEVFNSLSDHNRAMIRMGRRFPRITRWLMTVGLTYYARRAHFLPAHVIAKLPKSDRDCLADGPMMTALRRNWQEALRQGPIGTLLDGKLISGEWGFSPGEIRFPTELWHGEADTIVGPAVSRYLEKTLPNCRARYLPEAGHFSLGVNHLPELLKG